MAIICWHGLQGQGKTYGMVSTLITTMRENPVQVYSNMAGLSVPWGIYIDHVEEITDISHGIVLLDEAAIVIPAQFWQDLGRDLLTRFCQMRKRALHLWYTAQRFGGVNVNLREQTNETIECRKYGPYFHQKTQYPARKSGGGSKLSRYNPSVSGAYDTEELIASTGGSVGRVEAAPAPPFCTRRVAGGKTGRAASLRKPGEKLLLMEPWYSGWWGEVTVLQLRSEPARVLAWLKAEGHYDDAIPWSAQVRTELRRRAWLAVWGMTCESVPITCTPENPWCPGYDPATVRARRAEREENNAFATAVAKSQARAALKSYKS